MQEYLISMAINIILTTIGIALRDPAKAAAYKRALMKVKTQIEMLYPESDA